MGKALYRKYRPTRLEDVVGQESVVAPLAQAIKRKNFAHSYLFIGPRGCGKTSVARIFAHAINNFEYKLEDSYVDIIEIDAASNTGVDNIRELREKAVVSPTNGKYKVYIIDEVHMLSKSAFNALLKIMEEPPRHVIFIMATTDPQKIPATIVSRAQTYTFKLAPADIMKKHLKGIAEAEKIDIASDALDIIVRRGGGSFRDSISLLDQISNLSDQKISAEIVEKALGLPQDQILKELLSAYSEQNVAKITTYLEDLINTGIKPEIIASELISLIIADPKPEFLPLLKTLPDVYGQFTEAKLLVAMLSNIKPAAQKSSARAALTSNFIAAVAELSSGISNIINKCRHKEQDGVIHIYPTSTTYEKILKTSSNQELLLKAASGKKIIVHSPSEKPEPSQFSQISDIMGAVEEVQDSDGDPFAE